MQPLAKNIWINGDLTPWADAKIHVMSHALHYGTSVFEGIRVYDTPNGPCGFRLTDHVRRLFDSARIYHFPCPSPRTSWSRPARTWSVPRACVRPICDPWPSWASAGWACPRRLRTSAPTS
ncbi:hypothetical protein V8F63_05610 [Brevundimonas sp. LF-1]|uniref:hypothetical protein n=1 Tax=Brevundimonas sp. LF-1 TaxID=3126100 RepID=UPI0030E1A09B